MVNMSDKPNVVDHEVRLRLIEKRLDDLDKKDKSHQDTLKGQFTWIIGTVMTSIAGLILHAIKLI
jgi:hypothetical protein